MSVDLPAPFSPTRACTSPAAMVRLTRSRASTPGKRFGTSLTSLTSFSLTVLSTWPPGSVRRASPALPLPDAGGHGRHPPVDPWGLLVRARDAVLGRRGVVLAVGDED